MSTLTIPAPSFGGAEYSADDPTKNTEELSRYLLDLFSQLADAGFVLDDGQIEQEGDTEEEFQWSSLWERQTAILEAQTDRALTLRDLLVEKKDALPSDSVIEELTDMAISEGIDLLINLGISAVSTYLGGLTGGVTLPLILSGVHLLKEKYINGANLMPSLTNSISSMLNLPQSKENYYLRQDAIAANESFIGNMLSEMTAIEQYIGGTGGESIVKELQALTVALEKGLLTEKNGESVSVIQQALMTEQGGELKSVIQQALMTEQGGELKSVIQQALMTEQDGEMLPILQQALYWKDAQGEYQPLFPEALKCDPEDWESGTEQLDVLNEIKRNLLILARSENIIQCPHTGECIYTKTLDKR